MTNNLNENVLSIHTTLKKRRVINSTLKTLNKRRKISSAELDTIGEDLLNLGKQVISVIINNFLEITEESVLIRYLYIIEFLNFDEFVNPLIYTILKRELSDNFKANAINALYSFDVDISSPTFSKVLFDNDKMFYLFDEEFFGSIEKEEDVFVNALSWFSSLPYHKKMVILNKLKDVSDVKKVVFLEIIANINEPELSLHAIDILGTVKEFMAVDALKRIAEEYKEKLRGKRAERALSKLKLLGADLNGEESKDKKDKHVCYVSMIDSSGNYVLWVASPNNLNPELEVLCVLVNEQEGIIDCIGSSKMSKKEFSSLIRKAKDEDYFIKIDYEFCKTLIKNAVFYNKESENHLPLEFLYRKKIFKQAFIPKKYKPVFEGYNLKKIKNDKTLLSKLPTLNNICGINSWVILTGNFFVYADKFIQINEKFTSTAKKLKIEKLIEKVFHQLILPELDLIMQRLYFTADILRFDKKNKKYVKLILCAAENLSDPNKKPMKNPFITSFIMTNIKNAADLQSSVKNPIK
jgi:hypothetical protein